MLQEYLDGYGRLISVASLHALQLLLASVGASCMAHCISKELYTWHKFGGFVADEVVPYNACNEELVPVYVRLRSTGGHMRLRVIEISALAGCDVCPKNQQHCGG